MTTTAAAWRHVARMMDAPGYPFCDETVDCLCTTPTPDAASPCGFEGCDTETWQNDPHTCWCQYDPDNFTTAMPGHHPYQPTLCLCGHALEAVR